MPLAIGTRAPEFTLYDQNKQEVSSASLMGSKSLVVFIPFPFTGNCDNEGCQLRDGLAELNDLEAKVVVITTHALPTNAKWAAENGFDFPVLADYWPHGKTTQEYAAFNEKTGSANRVTYVLDANGVIQDVIATDSLGTPREYELYNQSLIKL